MFEIILRRCLKWLIIASASAIILFAVLINAVRLTIPLLNYQKDYFERWASNVLHQSVHINHITTGWRNFDPVINFKNVTVVDSKTKKSLFQIDQLSIGINPFKSIIYAKLSPNHLFLSGMRINVIEGEKGWSVKGLVLHEEKTSDLRDVENIFTWIKKQSDLTIRNVEINYRTLKGELISINNLHVEVENGILRQHVVGTGNLSKGISTQFKFLISNVMNDTNLYVNLEKFSFKQWLDIRFLQKYRQSFSIKQGQGNVELWAKLHKGELKSLQALVNANRLKLNVPSLKKELEINKIDANLYWQSYSNGWRLTADHVLLRMNGRKWNQNAFGIHVLNDQSTPSFIFNANHLDLEDLHLLGEDIGFWPKKMQELCQELQLKGRLKNFTLFAEPAKSYRVVSDFDNFGFHKKNNLFSASNLSGSVDMNALGGKLILKSPHARIQAEKIFKESLALKQLDLLVDWTHDNNSWNFNLRQSNVKDDNLNWEGYASVLIPQQSRPHIDLSGKFKINNLAAIKTYLPHQQVNSELLAWLRQAFLGGSITSGSISYKGHLDKISLTDKKDRLDIIANGDQVKLRYHPDWPAIENMRAHLEFHNNRLEITANRADLLGNSFNTLKGVIPDLKKPVLKVIGYSNSDLSAAAKFLSKTPLSAHTWMKEVALKGPINLNLKLNIPLSDEIKANIVADGHLSVAEGQLNLKKWGIILDDINGDFHLVNQKLWANRVDAKWFGSPVVIDINTVNTAKSPVIKFNIRGQLTTDLLQKQFHLPVLTNSLSGSSTYYGSLELHNDSEGNENNLNIMTDLKGIQSTLPSPYNKLKEEAVKLSTTISFSKDKLNKIEVHYKGLLPESNTSFNLTTADKGWLVKIDNPLIQGNIFAPSDFHKQWEAVFSRLYLPKLEKSQSNLEKLPPFKISINDFHYGEQSIGKLVLQISPMESGLKIDRLNIGSRLFDLDAAGKWYFKLGKSKTELRGRFLSNDIGAYFREIGKTRLLEGGHGYADFSLEWPASPTEFESNNMSGNVKIFFQDGRVMKVGNAAESEIGLGRILSLFSIQSLPKLPVKIVNLTKKGFAFNLFKGNFSLLKGVAKTKNASLIGDVGWIQINGLIDFSKESYDLNLKVIPNITSSLPLIITLAGGAFAGAVAWLVNEMVAPEVGKAAQSDYHIAGSWSEPVITLPPPAKINS